VGDGAHKCVYLGNVKGGINNLEASFDFKCFDYCIHLLHVMPINLCWLFYILQISKICLHWRYIQVIRKHVHVFIFRCFFVIGIQFSGN
jgi:hypothetical protein